MSRSSSGRSRKGRKLIDAVRITAREIDVLRLLACGFTNLQIAERLGLSLHTIQSHSKNIYRKLDVHSAGAAVWRAVELRLLTIDGTQEPVSRPSSGRPKR
jgi:DNA-binding NarL/FixJ family response regulator